LSDLHGTTSSNSILLSMHSFPLLSLEKLKTEYFVFVSNSSR
jgi:hypothetical protein